MSHTHNIHDTDTHFIIDPITRSISTESAKLTLAQYDHNSERYTFQMPRFVEGHDMFLCDTVEIHYNNINKRKTECNSNFYIVTDLGMSSSNNEFVTFSWLVSRGCTQIVGKLKFSLQFKCHDGEGNETYAWGTSSFDGISIIAVINNIETVIAEHSDFVDQVETELKKKADNAYVVEVFEQLKEYLEAGDTEKAVAVLDEAILNLTTLA